MSRTVQVTFDAADPAALSAFWAEALGYVFPPPPGRELGPDDDPQDRGPGFRPRAGAQRTPLHTVPRSSTMETGGRNDPVVAPSVLT